MSQVSIIDIESNNPQIPTNFIANIGSAVPIANTLEILGDTVPAGVLPVFTTGSGNTITTNVQISQAIAASNALNVGLAAFDSSSFTVDANGFVSFTGGAGTITAFNVDAHTAPGTNPVVPSVGGDITVTGAQVASGVVGTNVIRTDSLASNTYTIEIQRSTSSAASTLANNGVSHFDSSAFDVDANGFVQLNGGGIASTSFDVQANTAPGTDPVVPTAAGVVTVNGAAVANHSVVLETRSRAANAYNLEIQYATSAAATDATKAGVAHFDSANFTVDASGFVSLAGGGLAIDSIHPDSGTDPVVPTAAGLVNIIGSGSTTTVGSLNTLTIQLTGLTNHAVLVGAGTSTITKIAATANTGAVLQNNSGADPSYSTATYPSTTTINQLLYSSAANTVTGLATANRAVLTTTSAGVPVATALATDGQVIIGSTAGAPAAATLTAGVGVSITNASNSITIAAIGSGLTWSVITADQSAVIGNGYICNKASVLTLTLPASAAIGDIIRVTGINTALGWKVAQNANQRIHIGSNSTTAGITGSLASTNIRDSIEMVCVVAGASTEYNVISSIGNITVV